MNQHRYLVTLAADFDPPDAPAPAEYVKADRLEMIGNALVFYRAGIPFRGFAGAAWRQFELDDEPATQSPGKTR